MAGTVIIHKTLQAGFSNPSNLAKVITFIYSNDLANTSTAGSSLPLVALIFSLAVIFCKITTVLNYITVWLYNHIRSAIMQ